MRKLKNLDALLKNSWFFQEIILKFNFLHVFLMKLECMGFGRSTILWFKSYLNNRTFQVNIEDEYSNPGKLKCGVPQGSIWVL